MKNKKLSMRFHPFISHWIKKNNLQLSDTYTEIGYTAKPQKYKDRVFTLENPDETLKKLNQLYSLTLSKDFIKRKGFFKKSLEDIEELRKNLIKRGFKNPSKIYTGGIMIPSLSHLYIEYGLIKYSERIKDVEFIPLLKKPKLL